MNATYSLFHTQFYIKILAAHVTFKWHVTIVRSCMGWLLCVPLVASSGGSGAKTSILRWFNWKLLNYLFESKDAMRVIQI